MTTEQWDNTKLSAWLNCEQQGYYGHGYKGTGIVPKEPAIALAWGQAFHKAVETWCNEPDAGLDYYEAVFRGVYESLLPFDARNVLELKQDRHSIYNARRLLAAYIQKFVQSLYAPVVAERPFKEFLGLAGDTIIEWCGIIDRIVRYEDSFYGVELKTTSSYINENWRNQFNTSGQLKGYTWAGRQLYGDKFAGIIVHGVEKAAPPKPGYEKRARKPEELISAVGPIEFSPRIIQDWVENTLTKIEEIHRKLALGKFLRNDGDACNAYNFHGCAYRGICGADPSIRQQILEENYVQRVWNPLAENRSEMVGTWT